MQDNFQGGLKAFPFLGTGLKFHYMKFMGVWHQLRIDIGQSLIHIIDILTSRT